MRRRTFIAAAGASVLPLLGGCRTMGTGSAAASIPQAKLDRISIAGSVFKANFDNWEYAIPTARPRLTIFDYARYIREQFGVGKVELWQRQFFPGGLNDRNFAAVRAAADAAGVTVTNLQVEALPSLDAGGPAEREAVLNGIKAWLDKARILGAGSIRVNVTRQEGPVNLEAVIDTLRRAADYGQSIGVRVLVENHGGYTASIRDMVALVRSVNHEFCKITIDWGENTPPDDRYEMMQLAMPLTYIVSAKGYAFDPSTNQHTAYDVPRLVRNAEAGGFRGDYSIDFWGPAETLPTDTVEAMRQFIRSITDNMA
jgi:hypothetical protein